VSKSRLDWRGKPTQREIEKILGEALVEIGLRIEGEAKKQLWPGHGKLTGTLQRSIHAASPDYNFARENVEPASNSPERGNNAGEVVPKLDGQRLKIAVGTGMEYAMHIHFLYKYLTIALNKVRPQVLKVVQAHIDRRRG